MIRDVCYESSVSEITPQVGFFILFIIQLFFYTPHRSSKGSGNSWEEKSPTTLILYTARRVAGITIIVSPLSPSPQISEMVG